MSALNALVSPAAWLLAGSVMTGLAAWLAAAWVWGMATAERPDHLLPTPLEQRRRRLLRRRSPAYRWFEPLVDDLASVFRQTTPAAVEGLRRDLTLVEPPRPRQPEERWTPEEYLAVKQIEGLMVAVPAAALGYVLWGPPLAVLFAVLAAVAAPWVLASDVRRRAETYRAAVRSRLPMTIDLMALMLEAEATPLQAIATVACENADHPIGELFEALRESVEQSVPQHEALQNMADLLDDADVNEVVFTLTASAHSPGLKNILRSLSGPMRTRRVQHLEQASERAKVNITWPAIVIMIACLLIVFAVFGLPAGGGTP